jgi:hypothetical protein
MSRAWLLVPLLSALTALPRAGAAGEVVAPSAALRAAWSLAPSYAKHLDCGGLPILSSARVSDVALREAAYLVDHLLLGRDDLRAAIVAARIRLVVMSPQEFTTDVPEHHDLAPAAYWNRRARGLGATRERPAVSCGEENLLGLPGDPYSNENILVHEFAHVIHEFGLGGVDAGFDARLQAAFRAATAEGRWRGHYALTNHREYWAEGVQSWFACNRPSDPVNDRAALATYDPPLAALLAEVFAGNAWTCVPPRRRDPPSPHLAGFDPAAAGRFVWPPGLQEEVPERP